MTKLYGHFTKGLLMGLALAACVLGTSSTASAQNRQPARNLAAEAQLRVLIAQLEAETAAALAAQRRAQATPLPGGYTAVLGGNYGGVVSRPASAADIARGTGVIGGTPSTVGGLNPHTAATLNRFAPGLVDQSIASGNRMNQIWLAPTCVRGQYCW